MERVVNESYRPLMKIFKDNPRARATFNISGALVELLDQKGYRDVLDALKELLERGQVELTGSAAYHAFLPLLSKEEAIRQIELNDVFLRGQFGGLYQPKGFFSPELAFDYQTAKIVRDRGYEWLVAPELAYGSQPAWPNKTFYLEEVPGLKIFFRHKRASVLILAGISRTAESLLKVDLEDLVNQDIYILAVMDAETFGHHRPGMDDFLEEILKLESFRSIKVSEIIERFGESEKVSVRESSWSNEEQDFWLDKEKGVVSQNPFLLWKDPSNPIHQLQWEFAGWVVGLVKEKASGESRSRHALDKALGSDQFWWASAKPWWSLEMIEAGAFRLKELVEELPRVTEEQRRKAGEYYRRILEHAFDWQRTGKIRDAYRKAGDWKSTPLKERTPPDWYNLIILEFEDEMKKAAGNREFEKAIKWRDALIKLKKGTDIYDVLHVVDDLQTVRKIPSLKGVADHKPEEISEFAREHFIKGD